MSENTARSMERILCEGITDCLLGNFPDQVARFAVEAHRLRSEVLLAVAHGDAGRQDALDYVEGRQANVPLDPMRGGCWFCARSGATLFCKGWDAFYHQVCLDHERRVSPDNPELQEFP